MKKLSWVVVVIAIGVLFMAGQGTYTVVRAESELSGKVVETMDSGGYTYVLLEKEKVKTWIAFPQTKVVKGQTISLRSGPVMEKFHSKTLNRTFDKIIFSAGPAN